MLAQSIVQILPNAALLPRADFQNRFLQMLAFGDVDSGGDDVSGLFRRRQEAPCLTRRSGGERRPASPVALVIGWATGPRRAAEKLT